MRVISLKCNQSNNFMGSEKSLPCFSEFGKVSIIAPPFAKETQQIPLE